MEEKITLTKKELFDLMFEACLEAKLSTKPHEIGEYISDKISKLKPQIKS